MTKSLLMVTLVSIVMFYMARPIFSQEIDPYSQEVPKDVAISPSSKFDIYVEAPGEAPFEEADSPAMEYDRELAHHYSHKQLDFLEACSEKPSSKCGNEVFKNMLDETVPITDECCRDILKIGKDCHLGLVKLIFATYEYKNKASKGIPKSKQTWNECVFRVGSKIGAPVSFEQ
ncbi:ECA1 gametogenesis family protein (DUF784) [Arabidopsis thaliana]|uniref:ECA1 gametogenesis family protein (DUF784) n=1 Tax=Arabidopsis thaliana TaxID=3702 RepID=Q3ECV8_ARATH|nr:ECA1 gametogenesis family protein (DUF784) [Arabidopsis thaliana]AEE32170.1 ECA1 gametogenesis family protein (DUF784) [Arabidopsis thaliana]|eukprot:NP_175178.2 ECA1 gametogenesis family protein (DUF784) [Arabidopsis thaliana]